MTGFHRMKIINTVPEVHAFIPILIIISYAYVFWGKERKGKDIE